MTKQTARRQDSRAWMWRHAELLSGLGMGVVLVGGLVLFDMTPDEKARSVHAGSTIGELSSSISWVDEDADGGETIEIVLDQAPTYMANILADLGRNAVAITRGLQQHFREVNAKKIRFVARRQGRGIERIILADRVIALEFERAKLMELDLPPDFPFQLLLSSSDHVIYGTPDDRVIVEAFCHDEVSKLAAVFCSRELARR